MTSTKKKLFLEIVFIHREVLRRTAVSLAGSSDADDLVQETFAKAYRAFDRLKPESQVRPWLLTIMRNTFISHWRKSKLEREVLQRGVEERRASWLRPSDLAATSLRPPEEDLDDEVVDALEAVPDCYRSCVILVDLHQKSYYEAAEMTEQPIGTIQSRLFRGRRMLKSLLNDYAHREGYLSQAA